MISNTRLYGAAIAVVSGLYSLWGSSVASRMGTGSWLMVLLGGIVIVHGAILLTDYAERLGTMSGPIMIGYAIIMLLNQAAFGTGMMTNSGMMGMNGGSMSVGMGWDAGMVGLAVLMFISGVIMTRGIDGGEQTGGM